MQIGKIGRIKACSRQCDFVLTRTLKISMLAVCAFSSSDRNEMLVKAFFTEHWPICRQVVSMNGIIFCQ